MHTTHEDECSLRAETVYMSVLLATHAERPREGGAGRGGDEIAAFSAPNSTLMNLPLVVVAV